MTLKPLAVVTGGTRGIGAGISGHLYRGGYRVAAVYRADKKSAAAFEQSLPPGPGEIYTYQLDLTDSDAVQQFASAIVSEHGAPALLVNNAGFIARPSYWREQDIADARATVRGNLDVTLNVVWAFAPHLVDNGGGRIVNVSSTYASLGEPHVLAYTAAKAGVHALTKGLAMDLGPSGVTVNTVSPAVVRTEMTEAAGEEFIAIQRARTPVRALAEPSDVARCVQFFADNPMVNGIEIVVDGGLHLLGP